MRATHRIYWELNERDRELVRQWDGLLVAARTQAGHVPGLPDGAAREPARHR